MGASRRPLPGHVGLGGSGVNDCDPSGYLMEAYQNYRHRACLEISFCHEEMGDRKAAFRYAVLARDRHSYQSWCGTCLMESHAALRKRIERLERVAREGE